MGLRELWSGTGRVDDEGDRRPGARGWAMRGGGHTAVIPRLPEWHGTTNQLCGLWPFATATGTPMVGVPLGHHLLTNVTVACDPVMWYSQARLLNNPSMFLVGSPGKGKSSLVRRMALGLCGFGVAPIVAGDLKPDYADLIAALGGNIVKLGRGLGRLNPLDPGDVMSAADRLTGQAREHLIEDALGRQLTMVQTLIGLNRGAEPNDHESTLLSAGLRLLDDRRRSTGKVPTLLDLTQLISEAPDVLRDVALDRDDMGQYRRTTDPLIRSIRALAEGSLGAIFSGETTTKLDLTNPAGLCIDISALNASDQRLKGAVLSACWGEVFAHINALHALMDAEDQFGRPLEPRRNWCVIVDEMWQVLQAGGGMIDRLNELTRLDRSKYGVGTILITHSLGDLIQSDPAARAKAVGLADRTGMFALTGMPKTEIAALREVFDLTDREAQLLSRWSGVATWNGRGQAQSPPGVGKVLLKVGGKAGIPVQVRLTDIERRLGDTDQRWDAVRYDGPVANGVTVG